MKLSYHDAWADNYTTSITAQTNPIWSKLNTTAINMKNDSPTIVDIHVGLTHYRGSISVLTGCNWVALPGFHLHNSTSMLTGIIIAQKNKVTSQPRNRIMPRMSTLSLIIGPGRTELQAQARPWPGVVGLLFLNGPGYLSKGKAQAQPTGLP